MEIDKERRERGRIRGTEPLRRGEGGTAKEEGGSEGAPLAPVLAWLEDLPPFAKVLEALAAGRQVQVPLLPAARPFLLAALHARLQVPLLAVVPSVDEAQAVDEALRLAHPRLHQVRLFPPRDLLPYERGAVSPEVAAARLGVLADLAAGEPLLVVAPVRALLEPTLPREAWPPLEVAVGDRLPLLETARRLQGWGYRPVPRVTQPGELARRGGILDLWSPLHPWPVRLELWGNEVEEIRAFDPATQRAHRTLRRIRIGRPFEGLGERWPQARERLLMVARTLRPEERRRWLEELERAETVPPEDAGLYLPYLWPEPPVTLAGLWPGLRALWPGWEMVARNLRAEDVDRRRALIEAGELPGDYPGVYVDLPPQGEARALLFRPHDGSWPVEPVPPLDPKALDRRKPWVIVVPRPEKGVAWARAQGQRVWSGPIGAEPGAWVVKGRLAAGWQAPGGVLLTAREALGRAPKVRPEEPAPGLPPSGRLFPPEAPHPPSELPPGGKGRGGEGTPKPLPDWLARLEPGAYAVHVDHGIGIYRGLERRRLGGQEREYIVLEYAEGDRLYVPVEQADRVRRYVGEPQPTLTRLGSGQWQRTVRRARKAAEAIARDLVELYAARQLARGIPFSPDTPWQRELEESFPYEETPDQARAIAEVKADMERPRPMDRLVCGDVGYGKTEVAIRAAFKAVQDGYQVAVLVPTTILAQQHLETFRARLGPFPVRIEALSRLQSPAQRRRVLEGLASGRVDIVIGTHRLLSKDVRFKRLGLVIVDEEHRFGVRQKERLKALKLDVDVLTLSATPIPRTLQMALSGLRPMSLIQTPPPGRRPVRTYLERRRPDLIRAAIRRELERGGQVFFVHNRIAALPGLVEEVRRLVPEARVGMAHGRMAERELARTMEAFAAGEIDVLVSTAIVESGLDFPNANTLIVDDADRFGLAQLYQLRGRVGRGGVRAYAYLLYRPGARLTPSARRRLRAVMEASSLGGGLQLALEDLEIRGAGSLLGEAQSGHIAAVGLDLYTRLLAQAVEGLRREGKLPEGPEGSPPPPAEGVPKASVQLPLAASLPPEYVLDPETRLELYQRLAAAETLEEVEDLAAELRDRFGPLPPPARDLLFGTRVRIRATELGLAAVRWRDGWIELEEREPGREAVRLSARAARLGGRYGGGVLRWRAGEGWREEVWAALGGGEEASPGQKR